MPSRKHKTTQNRVSDHTVNSNRVLVHGNKRSRSLIIKKTKIEPSTDQIKVDQQLDKQNKTGDPPVTIKQMSRRQKYQENINNFPSSSGNINRPPSYVNESVTTIK
ncbi:unnamed protein product, partial [Rotaria sp. Silwood2]